jgi:YD repeat-containing protein
MTPSHGASQGYDTYKYINRVTDRNGHRTDFTNDSITGNLLQVQFPLTGGDTPGQGNTRPTVAYTYANKYYLNTIQGENGQITTITRNANNNRVTRIDYPDGGYETFSYDPAHFSQISTHRMKTGGTETFAYDGQHRLQNYSDPYHDNTSNPSNTYYYGALDRVSRIADALNHSINFDYNDRGQVTVTTLPWINGVRYTISNLYNSDGTLQSRTDELGHRTSYEYDDYRRLKTVTPPVRGAGDNGTYTTHFYYGANPWDSVNDYKLTDRKVTYVVPPSTGARKIKAVYDDNRRKTLVTLAPGTLGEANTSYIYDNVGNVTWITSPGGHWINTAYDERNRPSSISDLGRVANFTYDTAGRRKTISRPNGQLITYNAFDAMNRVTQYTTTQTPDPDAVTVLSYYTTADGTNAPVGLLKTMKDPRLMALNSTEYYKYEYDLVGRKAKITYPRPQANGSQTDERWS